MEARARDDPVLRAQNAGADAALIFAEHANARATRYKKNV